MSDDEFEQQGETQGGGEGLFDDGEGEGEGEEVKAEHQAMEEDEGLGMTQEDAGDMFGGDLDVRGEVMGDEQDDDAGAAAAGGGGGGRLKKLGKGKKDRGEKEKKEKKKKEKEVRSKRKKETPEEKEERRQKRREEWVAKGGKEEDFIDDDGAGSFDEEDVVRVEGGIDSENDQSSGGINSEVEREEGRGGKGSEPEKKTHIQQTLDRIKQAKKKKRNETEEDRERMKSYVDAVTKKMVDAITEDENAVASGRPAIAKLSLVDEACAVIAKRNLQAIFVDNSIAGVLGRWLAPAVDAQDRMVLPNVKVRTKVLSLLKILPLETDQISTSEVGRRVADLWRFEDDAGNRDLVQQLVIKWSKPVLQQHAERFKKRRLEDEGLEQEQEEDDLEQARKKVRQDMQDEYADEEAKEKRIHPRLAVAPARNFRAAVRSDHIEVKKKSAKEKDASASHKITKRLLDLKRNKP
eukprot:GDKI01033259.1.p1 GENE.GDKI01033259.1~~GDKI01033259.1.p1  ORF type:complete len:465 (-),score=173.51 GDKI01033259.1:19-1413(-)